MAKEKHYIQTSLDGFDGCSIGNDPIDSDTQGCVVMIAVTIGDPGTTVTDIYIGDQMVQVTNSDLREAAALHEDLCDTEGG